MTPVWQCIGIVVWPWVLAGGKVNSRIYGEISSNWMGCPWTFLRISLHFLLYSSCVCVHIHAVCITRRSCSRAWDQPQSPLYFLRHCRSLILEVPWHFAVCSQHWGHGCILQLLPFLCACWGSSLGPYVCTVSTKPHSHLPRPWRSDQFIWVKYVKFSVSDPSSSGFMFCGQFL